MASIAQRVLDEIKKQGMVTALWANGKPVDNCTLAWNANAVEQLEALISEEIIKAAEREMRKTKNNPP